jgi:ABC-type transport system involved in Fe-S cluster assembly fused permease/ATPase subunit
MDEGTSALDIQTEKKLFGGLEYELKNVTMINVAHRIETILNSDIIFAFQGG